MRPLERAKGVLLLQDVYCLFNRARGTALISPDDLVNACSGFERLRLPLRLRHFPRLVTALAIADRTGIC